MSVLLGASLAPRAVPCYPAVWMDEHRTTSHPSEAVGLVGVAP